MYKKLSKRVIKWGTGLLLIPVLVYAQVTYAQVNYGLEDTQFYPVFGAKGMVASQEQMATRIGVDVLKQGGNAIDAAVAVGFALAVTFPQAGNIGGGGFMLIQLADGTQTSIDFREMAPGKASRDMFLDEFGDVDSRAALTGHLAFGTPGTVAGLLYALEKYGTQARPVVLDPAIALAIKGVSVSRSLDAAFMRYGQAVMAPHASSRAIFFNEAGVALRVNELLVQADLGNTLTLIRDHGRDGFYKGATGVKIVAEMQKNGGLITLEDLAHYAVVERVPVKGTYKGYDIISMPPPSSGGVHIIQILNILENFDLQAMGHNSADTIHIMSEAMKYAYADRAVYLGDPDFVKVPVVALTSKAYAQSIAARIALNGVSAADALQESDLTPYESDQTTHYSVMDQWGNAAVVTYTLNTNFGSGIVVEGTGVLFNNQMDDFSVKPGVPNIYGLMGGQSNAIEAYKRPISSMSPTIVSEEGRVLLVTGSPGGSRIITTVLQVLLNTLEFKMNVAEATAAPRIHHQGLPDYIRVEKGIGRDTIDLLKAKGHQVSVKPVMGSAQSIMRTDEGFWGASDPRSESALSLGF